MDPAQEQPHWDDSALSQPEPPQQLLFLHEHHFPFLALLSLATPGPAGLAEMRRRTSAGLGDALEEVRANHSLWITVLGVCLRDWDCSNTCNKLQW